MVIGGRLEQLAQQHHPGPIQASIRYNCLLSLQELQPGVKSLEELAVLLQKRRRLLVDMTISLSRLRTEESTTGIEFSDLTDIQEEGDSVTPEALILDLRTRSFGTFTSNRPDSSVQDPINIMRLAKL